MFSMNALKAYRGSYMSAHVSLHLIIEMRKRDEMRGRAFRNEFNKFKTTLTILPYNILSTVSFHNVTKCTIKQGNFDREVIMFWY